MVPPESNSRLGFINPGLTFVMNARLMLGQLSLTDPKMEVLTSGRSAVTNDSPQGFGDDSPYIFGLVKSPNSP